MDFKAPAFTIGKLVIEEERYMVFIFFIFYLSIKELRLSHDNLKIARTRN